MTIIKGLQQWALHALLIIALVQHAAPFRLLSKQIGIPFSASAPQDDLEAFIRPDVADTTGIYKHALDILSTAQTSPTCNRIATSNLLKSCHAIDGSLQSSEHNAEYLKSVYAARLASCEIEDAGSTLPQQCQALSTFKVNQLGTYLTKQLNGCLQALESRPQWWTSYSNSKQNAIALCKVVRADIDKDDMIKLHEKMVKTQAETHGLLAKTTKAMSQDLEALQTEFDEARRGFQDRLDLDMAISSEKARTYLESLISTIGTTLNGMFSRVEATGDAIAAQSVEILSTANRANKATANLEQKVGQVFSKVITGSSELANIQTSQWETSRGAANDLLTSMQSIQDVHVVALVQTMRDVGLQLDSSNRLIAQIYDRQSHIEDRMAHLTQSFSSLESGAAALTATQLAQAETQSRLHDQMETEMQAAQGYLTDVTRSAVHLQQIITDTAAKIQSMTGFAKVFSSVFDWVVALLVILALVAAAFIIRVVCRLTRWGGGASLLLTVFILAKDYTSFFDRLTAISPSIRATLDIALADTFLLSSIIFGITLCATLISYAIKNYTHSTPWTFAPSLAPFLSLPTYRTRSTDGLTEKDKDTPEQA